MVNIMLETFLTSPSNRLMRRLAFIRSTTFINLGRRLLSGNSSVLPSLAVKSLSSIAIPLISSQLFSLRFAKLRDYFVPGRTKAKLWIQFTSIGIREFGGNDLLIWGLYRFIRGARSARGNNGHFFQITDWVSPCFLASLH